MPANTAIKTEAPETITVYTPLDNAERVVIVSPEKPFYDGMPIRAGQRGFYARAGCTTFRMATTEETASEETAALSLKQYEVAMSDKRGWVMD